MYIIIIPAALYCFMFINFKETGKCEAYLLAKGIIVMIILAFTHEEDYIKLTPNIKVALGRKIEM